MKKLLFIILALLISLVGCNQGSYQNSESEISNSDLSSFEVSEESSFSEEKEAQIEIEYYFKDGQIFNRTKKKGIVGESYKFTSPQLNFMKPEVEEIEFVLSEEGFYQKVIYDYSYEVVQEVNNGQKFNYFMVDESKGLSFNYVISGNNSHWNEIFTNEYFIIYNAYLRAQDLDYYADFKSGSAIKSNNIVNDALLTNEENEVFVSISINPDSSITFYKNGVLAYTFLPGMLPDSKEYRNDDVQEKKIKDLVENIFKGLSDTGFKVGKGDFKIKNLSINYALDDYQARALYREQVHTSVLYVDEFGNELFDRKSIIDIGGTEYSFTSPSLENYTCDKELVSGVTSKDKTEKVVYTFDGEEQISLEEKNNKSNILNQANCFQWGNTSMWYEIVSEIEGDFIVRLNYHLNGSTSLAGSTNKDECCWRTNLTIIHNPTNNDRYVARMDCFGWFNDVNSDGINIGNNESVGTEYFDNPHLDSYNVFNDCDVTQTIARKGDKLSMNFIIKPNKVGYENRVYKRNFSMDNVTIEKLNISFSAEDAIVTINSVKIKTM